MVRRFVGIDPPYDKIVRDPDRWLREKSTRRRQAEEGFCISSSVMLSLWSGRSTWVWESPRLRPVLSDSSWCSMLTERKILDMATTVITEKIIADLIDDEVIKLLPHFVPAPAVCVVDRSAPLPCVCNISPPASELCQLNT